MSENTVPCPGCAAGMKLDQEVCSACRRPRDELEIQQGRDRLLEGAQKRRRRPFAIARLAVGLAALAWAFHHRGFFLARASGLRDEFRQEMKDVENPATRTPKTAEGAAMIATLRGSTDSPSPASPPSSEDLPIPSLNPAEQWAVCGRSYDLITLAPFAGVELNFSIAGNPASGQWYKKAVTDDSGRFCIVLPRLKEGSFEIRGSHPKYASTVLYESDIPYAALDLEKRRDLARGAQDGDVALPELNDVPGAAAARRDVFLAPGH